MSGQKGCKSVSKEEKVQGEEEDEADADGPPQLVVVTFKVVKKDTRFGYAVALVGSSPLLGRWDGARALQMSTNTTDFPEWSCTVGLPRGQTHEYKYVVIGLRKHNVVEWETQLENRVFGVPKDPECPPETAIIVRDGVFGEAPHPAKAGDIPLKMTTQWIDWGWLNDGCQMWLRVNERRVKFLYGTREFNYKPFAAPIFPNWTDFYFEVRQLPTKDPSIWTVDAPSLQMLSFFIDFWPADCVHQTSNLIGRTMILWEELRNLRGTLVRPILCPKNLHLVGSLEIDFLVALPFKHPENNVRASYRQYWRSRPALNVGHRGFGASGASLSIEENTLLAFETAPQYGASYVEMDVQLTADAVPVISHDMVQRVRISQSDCEPRTPPLEVLIQSVKWDLLRRIRPLSRTMTVHSSSRPALVPRRGKLTRSHSAGDLNEQAGTADPTLPSTPHFGWLSRGGHYSEDRTSEESSVSVGDGFGRSLSKGHSHGLVREGLATLLEVFERVPPSLGFNLEIKYPLVPRGNCSSYVERNVMLDKILQVVFDVAGKRRVVFSSFDPDLCVLVSIKQPRYPVLLLTTAGTEPDIVDDPRINNLQQAVQFALAHRLKGIVAESTPIVKNTSLISEIKALGLIVFTYGKNNNDAELCELQRRAGVDAIISDNPEVFSEEGILELVERIKHRTRRMRRLAITLAKGEGEGGKENAGEAHRERAISTPASLDTPVALNAPRTPATQQDSAGTPPAALNAPRAPASEGDSDDDDLDFTSTPMFQGPYEPPDTPLHF